MELNLEQIKLDPFKWADNLNLTVGNFNLNFFQKYHRLQKTALTLSLVALGFWVVCGFDSCAGQLIHVLMNVPNILLGKMTFEGLVTVWNDFYGKDFHYSAVVIYGLCFYFLSRHFDKHGIAKTKNVCYSAALTWVSIGLFELYWMASYAYFQNQPWVLKLAMPQLRIIIQNVGFMLGAGLLTVLYMWADSYILDKKGDPVGKVWRFNWSWVSMGLVGLSVLSAVAWWYYPLPVERFSVTYESGEVWSNSGMFPQTLYTIDVNPSDGVNAGVWFWVENDLVHGLNTLVKALFTLCILNIGRIKMVSKK